MRSANDGLRFVLELCALAALAYWGFRTASDAVQWVLGVAGPLAMAVIWGMFMSPKAPRRTHDPVRLMAEVAIFGLAAAALADADQSALAIALAVAVAVHLILTFPLDQREPPAARPPGDRTRERHRCGAARRAATMRWRRFERNRPVARFEKDRCLWVTVGLPPRPDGAAP